MIENLNLNHLYINKYPSSAKVKSNSNNISYPKSQCKRKLTKEKNPEGINIIKKSISSSNITINSINKEEKKLEIYNNNYSNNNYNLNYNNINYFAQTDNNNLIEKSILRERYNDPNFFTGSKNNNFFINNMNADININIQNTNQNNTIKEKKIINVKNKSQNNFYINGIPNFRSHNNNIMLLQKYEDHCRNKIKLDQNSSFNIYNNTFNLNNIYNTIKKKDTNNYNPFNSNENSKFIESQNSNQTTSKVIGKSKKIYNEYIINKDINNNISNNINNINEYIPTQKTKIKLTKNNLSKTTKDFYKKPITGNMKILSSKKNKLINKEDNNISTRFKNLFIKKNPPTKCISHNKLNSDNMHKRINNSYSENIIKSIDNINNLKKNIYTNINEDNNISEIINKYKYNNIKSNCKINISDNKRIVGSERIINNNISNTLYLHKYNIPSNKVKITQKKNDSNNNSFFSQNNYLDEKKYNSNNINRNHTKQIHIKNYSYDLINKKIEKSERKITNLKNSLNIRKNLGNKNSLYTINKIKSNAFKELLLDNKKDKNDSLQIKVKESLNKNNNSPIKITNKKDDTIYDETIIVNDSDVYGTLSINQTLNKEKDNHKNNNKEGNNNNNSQDNNNSMKEIITIDYSDKNNHNDKEKQNRQIKIEDLLKNKNLTNNKLTKIMVNINEKSKNIKTNHIYYKSYYSLSIAGKNYGARKTNQDTPVTFVKLNNIEGFNIFGVLDGHGVNGHHVSKFLGEHLVKQITSNQYINKEKELDKIYKAIKKSNYEILMNIFLDLDKKLGKQKFDVNFSGTTCVLVIQIGTKLICANVGDSRAILVYDKSKDAKEGNLKDSEIFELSHDFKPDLPDEKKRILMMGGTVDQMLDLNGQRGGPQRVWAKNKNYPGLAMSRSLGDFKGKQCGIIPIPEIIEYDLNEKSRYMVICSDGVWEFLSNQKVMEIGNEYYVKNDIIGFANKLIDVSEDLWERKDVVVDDITAVIVFF